MVGKVVGDVVDMFSPAAEFTVQYGPKHVANGCEIKPSAAADKPKVNILGPRIPSSHYALVCDILYLAIGWCIILSHIAILASSLYVPKIRCYSSCLLFFGNCNLVGHGGP